MKVITNSRGSGDYITLKSNTGRTLFSGHRISAANLREILELVVIDERTELIEVTDEEMENLE